jgi:DNA-directed RNA polymerase specialized sigma24 family protein
MSTDRPVSTVAYAEDLVRRVRANDPHAFDELYSRYSPRVFGYLFQRLNGNAEEAEDLTADVFTRVYEKIDGFQPQGKSLAETAEVVGRNEDAVKKLQARGLASLRRRIECLSGCWRVDLEQAS